MREPLDRQSDNVLTGLTRESAIRRDALGRWFHEGRLIGHPNIIRAFDRWIARAEDGRYCLKNDFDWVYVAIEGAPLFVRSVTIGDYGAIILSLSDECDYALQPESLRLGPDGVLYCDVREKSMTARFDRSAMMKLEELIDEDEKGIYLKLGDKLVRPPIVENPLEPFEDDERVKDA